jgi:choline dehydrogenase-like flavoprotein
MIDVTSKVWDLVVVGSGPSGGRIAYDMVRKGASVLLLEAGPHFKTSDFPKSELQYSGQMFWGGGAELNHDARLGFLRARCVGGTSVVNQALLDRFDSYVWDEWKETSGIELSDSEMEKHYLAVETSLSLQEIPEKHFGKNTKLFLRAFEQKNLGWTALRRAQKNCDIDQGNDCMACLGGCPRASKQSTLVTSVEPGLRAGLKLLANCEVQTVTENGGGIAANAVLHDKEKQTKSTVVIRGKALVLAAGSFGSTKILLQSGYAESLPRLGKGIACHPQYMTYSLFDEPVDSFKGAFQCVKSYDSDLRQQGLKFENVFAPPIATAMLFEGFGAKHQEQMKKYRYLASMEVAIRDEAVGELSVLKGGKLQIQKSLTSRDRSRVQNGLKLVEEMYRAIGAKEIIKCPQGFGLHLMGGCAIGTSVENSVVNPEFKIHNSQNIFIADSSIFPSAPGINPSLSVMALSHRALPFIERGAT